MHRIKISMTGDESDFQQNFEYHLEAKSTFCTENFDNFIQMLSMCGNGTFWWLRLSVTQDE
jgi:hypothetical protein